MQKIVQVRDGKIVSLMGENTTNRFYEQSEKLKIALKSFSREDIAAGLQKHFEDVVTQYIQYYVEETGVGNLALAAVFLPT